MIDRGGTGSGAVDGRGAPGQGSDGRGELRETLLTEREATHGGWHVQAPLAQRFKALMRESPNWPILPPALREALELKATKLARLLCGDPLHKDHWLDDAGYSELVVEMIDQAADRGLPF